MCYLDPFQAVARGFRGPQADAQPALLAPGRGAVVFPGFAGEAGGRCSASVPVAALRPGGGGSWGLDWHPHRAEWQRCGLCECPMEGGEWGEGGSYQVTMFHPKKFKKKSVYLILMSPHCDCLYRCICLLRHWPKGLLKWECQALLPTALHLRLYWSVLQLVCLVFL